MKTEKIIEIVRELPCKLTEEEYQSKSKELTRLLRQKAGYADEKAATARHYGSLIAEIDKEIADLLPLVETGSEVRQVKCRVEYNVPKKGKKTVSRADSGEVVEIADMNPDECQDMFLNAEDESETESEPIPFKKAK